MHGLKNVGTQADFDKKVKAAKEKRTKEATKKFVSDYATTLGSGKKAKSDAKLPAGVTYLPNSKMYQWKSGDKVYKAATFAELKQAIVNTGDTVLIAQFQKDVLDKMTTQVQ